MTNHTSYDIGKIVTDLLTIAKVAMPEYLYEIDPRIRSALLLLAFVNGADSKRMSAEMLPPVMPLLGEADPADPVAHDVLEKLNASPDPDFEVAAGLDAFLAETGAPATRPAAIEHILRDWLIGHGYIAHRSADDLN